jgi:hypothetical protein
MLIKDELCNEYSIKGLEQAKKKFIGIRLLQNV